MVSAHIMFYVHDYIVLFSKEFHHVKFIFTMDPNV